MRQWKRSEFPLTAPDTFWSFDHRLCLSCVEGISKRFPSDQFAHRFDAGVHKILRPALNVLNGCGANVDAQTVIKGGEHFLKLHWALHDFRADAVRSADHLAGAHAAPGEQG